MADVAARGAARARCYAYTDALEKIADFRHLRPNGTRTDDAQRLEQEITEAWNTWSMDMLDRVAGEFQRALRQGDVEQAGDLLESVEETAT